MKLKSLFSLLLSIIMVLLVFCSPACAETAKPYVISFNDDIAIRLLSDGSIEATVEAYDQAEWETFKEEGPYWATQYTDEEYRAIIDSYDSIASYEKMLASKDYVDVSAGSYGTLAAVHEDGSVTFNLRAEKRFRTTSGNSLWDYVKEIELGAYTVIALRKNGTVSIGGLPFYMPTKGTHPSKWKNVTAIKHDLISLGLKEDGTVYYASPNYDFRFPNDVVPLETISDWTDIVQMTTYPVSFAAAAVKSDGTVVFAGENAAILGDVADWTDIVKVVGGYNITIGLKKDGTLVSTCGNLNGVPGKVIDVYAGSCNILAVLEDGSCCIIDNPETSNWITISGSRPAADWKFAVNDAASSASSAPAEAETAAAFDVSEYPAGSVIEFGRYEQDKRTSNGSEPIEWIVIENDGAKLTLLAKYGLAIQPYDVSGKDGLTWSESMLRTWLNSDFLNEAFSQEEQKVLVMQTVDTVQQNQMQSVSSEELITLLSGSEAATLSKDWLIAYPSKAAQNYIQNPPCFWWLRDGQNVNGSGRIIGNTFAGASENDWYARTNFGECIVRPLITVSFGTQNKVCPSCSWETDMMDAVFCMQCGTKF